MPTCINEFTVGLNATYTSDGYIFMIGDVVKGCVRLHLLQHLSLTTIRITIKGKGFVHWTEQALRGAGEPRFKDTHHHSASEDYFEQTFVLFGQTKADKPDKCYLSAGRYTYPFQYQLPPKLPCSFEGEHGYVRYWVRAVIEKGREICHVTKVPFTVISPLDLNLVPDSSTPVQETAEKRLCCFCCRSGPISAMLCLQKRGFVPGEPIRFGAEVSNLSKRKMGSYSVELKMTTLFKTLTKCRSITKQICKTRRGSVGKGDTDQWMSDQLVVPSIPPSCLIGCGIISINYTLELRVDPVGPAFDLTLPIEVVIGTLPHRPVQEQHYVNVHRASPCYHGNSRHSNDTHHSRHSNEGHNGHHSNEIRSQGSRHGNELPSNVHHSNDNSSNRSSNISHETNRTVPSHSQHRVGVPVLPTQGGQLIMNPAYAQPVANQARGPHPGPSSGERSQGQQRPSSRASSAPSTTSTSSLQQSQVTAVFAESAFGRNSIRFEDDGDGQRIKFAPVYPYYQWRR